MGIFGGSSERSPQDQVDLADLKARVTRLEATVAQLQAQLAGGAPAVAGVAPVAAQADWMLEIRDLLQRDKKIQAIKLYREHTGVGLKEAKDAVEAMP